MAKQRAVELSREQALAAKPVTAEILKREDLEDGGQRVTIRYVTTRMRRWLLRIPDSATRTYELDAMGVEVLEMCNGHKTVRSIIRRFAKTHGLNEAEAEAAVTQFLRTMVGKGLVMIVVPKAAK